MKPTTVVPELRSRLLDVNDAAAEWSTDTGGTPSITAARERQASWLELFFDLVFVAAIAALASQLHDDHSVTGLVAFAGLFVPVWWAWMGYTWYATGFDTGDRWSRMGLLVGMLGVAVLSAGVDGAAHGDSETFVVAYAGLLVVLVVLYARAWSRVDVMRPLTARYGIGYAVGTVTWAASLCFAEGSRPVLWAAAMTVLLATPVAATRSTSVRAHDNRHIAERYGLFTIIVLGESVVVTVAGLNTESSVAATATAVLGFVIAVTIWWVYFERWQVMPSRGLIAGFVWAQGHLLIFAGVAAMAVGIEFCVEASAAGEELRPADTLPLGTGAAAYLIAMAAIREVTRQCDGVVVMRLAVAGALVAVAILGQGLPSLTFVAIIAGLVIGEAITELGSRTG